MKRNPSFLANNEIDSDPIENVESPTTFSKPFTSCFSKQEKKPRKKQIKKQPLTKKQINYVLDYLVSGSNKKIKQNLNT